MGTWGEGAFDNDAAADWAHRFERADRASGIALIEDALGRAAGTPASSYLGASDGDLTVAAAELVAYLADQPVEESAYNRTAFEWADRVDALAGPELTGLALQALTRITGDDSELADLWDEGPSAWRASIAELAAKLRDARPDPAAEQLVAGHFYQSAARALVAIPAADGAGIYAVSFFVWDQEDDPRRPALTIGYNTEAQVQHALAAPPAHSPGPPGDEAQARWNYAYWLRNELAVIGDDTSDPEGATLIEAQIKARGWWYSEPDGSTDQDWAQADAAAEQIDGYFTELIDGYFTELYVRTARELHAEGVISSTFGRPIPVLIHDLEYHAWVADLTGDANPPGLAETFTTWVRSR